jgi:alpha-glucosidase
MEGWRGIPKLLKKYFFLFLPFLFLSTKFITPPIVLNNIDSDYVFSDQTENFLLNNNKNILLKIRTKKDNVKHVKLCIITNQLTCFDMVKNIVNSIFDYWSYNYKIENKGEFRYYFELYNKERKDYYGVFGFKNYLDDNNSFKYSTKINTPSWMRDAIFYQIFLDRFYDGNKNNNVTYQEYEYIKQTVFTHTNWYDLPLNQADFFGGDLEGIEKKITYLKDLGINAIYLNPIFQSPSNHKYDTQDYTLIDPHFGTNEYFKKLVNILHKNDIKIILDGVFNHTGDRHIWLDKFHLYPTNGAFESQESIYYNFYNFTEWPNKYISWWGYDTLPKLNYNSRHLRELLYLRGSDSIIGKWLSEYNIDGWRLDVPNEVGGNGSTGDHSVWKEFRNVVKNINNNAVIIGEIWYNSLDYLDGTELDGITNYEGFGNPISLFLTKSYVSGAKANQLSVSQFDNILNATRANIALQAQESSFNMLTSHDTPRFLTRIIGADSGGPYFARSFIEEEENNIKKLFLGIIFQLTYIGAPIIYYGDEVGMTGAHDPDNRRSFYWKYEDEFERIRIRDFYKSLINLRKETTALKYGSFLTLYKNDYENVYAYGRWYGDEKVVVILNNCENEREISIPVRRFEAIDDLVFFDYFDKILYRVKEGSLSLKLPSFSGVILVANNKS